MERTNSSMEGRGKRRLEGGDDDDEQQQPVRNRPALSSVIIEARKVDCPHCSSLEPIIRRVVSEEFERFLAKLGCARLIGRSSTQRIKGPDERNLQLHFKSRLSLPLFTGGKVEAEQGAAIHVELIDANSVYVVTSGPESSVKLDVVVLEGDFNNEDDEGWSQEEFDRHVVKERNGKRPLLTGDLQVTLKEGVGTLRDLTFTDNSSWTRSKKFRLGLKVSSGYCEGVRIREAKTEAFIIRDHRGELYKKHYPPALIDQVWRLENIKKDGSFHKKLNVIGIYTVEDFLRLLVRDSKELRNTLGSGMSSKMWDALIEHARTCVLSEKLYVYYPDESRNVGVVFNNIYELSGLVDSDQYFPEDSLSDSQKVNLDTWVKKAYDNWNQIVEYDGKTLLTLKQNKESSTSQSDLPLVPVNYPHSSNHLRPPFTFPVSLPFGPSSMGQKMLIGGSGYNDNMTRRINSNTFSQFELAPFTQQVNHTNQITSTSYGNGVGIALSPSHSSPFDSSLQQASINPFEGWSNNPDKCTEVLLSEVLLSGEENHQILRNEDMQHLVRNEFSIGNPSATVPEDEMLENEDMQHLLGNEFSIGNASASVPENEMLQNEDMQLLLGNEFSIGNASATVWENEMLENEDMQHLLGNEFSIGNASASVPENEMLQNEDMQLLLGNEFSIGNASATVWENEMLENEDMQHLLGNEFSIGNASATVPENEMLENEDMQHLLRNEFSKGNAFVTVPEDVFNFPSYMTSPAPGFSYGNDGVHGVRMHETIVGWLKIKGAMRWGVFIRKRAAERRARIVELDDE